MAIVFPDRQNVPVATAKDVLQRTAMAVGFQSEPAAMMAQSAWMLTNRGIDGVGYLLRYLSMVHPSTANAETLFNLPQIMHRPQTPFIFATALMHELDAKGPPANGKGKQGPTIGAPLLALPVLNRFLASKSSAAPAVEIVINKGKIAYDESGIRCQIKDPLADEWVLPAANTQMQLVFLNRAKLALRPWTRMAKSDQIALPSERTPDGVIPVGNPNLRAPNI